MSGSSPRSRIGVDWRFGMRCVSNTYLAPRSGCPRRPGCSPRLPSTDVIPGAVSDILWIRGARESHCEWYNYRGQVKWAYPHNSPLHYEPALAGALDSVQPIEEPHTSRHSQV